MDIIRHYFPQLSNFQLQQFEKLAILYREWNPKINVISRKDIDDLEVHHILHSLSIARIFNFTAGISILDAGTGGGLPGIPLAILLPHVRFTLVDSIRKKIEVVEAIKRELHLDNVFPVWIRYESLDNKYDFILGRAVTDLQGFSNLLKKNLVVPPKGKEQETGIIYLKGGDFEDELPALQMDYKVYLLRDYFSEPYFETKKLVHIYRNK